MTVQTSIVRTRQQGRLFFVQDQHDLQISSECHAKLYFRQILERQVNLNTKYDQSRSQVFFCTKLPTLLFQKLWQPP